eukprot:gene23382-24812_t
MKHRGKVASKNIKKHGAVKQTKRLLVTLAVAGAVCGSAQAQQAANSGSSVNVYGLLDVWMGSTKNAGQDKGASVMTANGMQGSFIGFSGSEDLGGGLRTIFTLESFLSLDTGALGRTPADPFWGRNSFVGLSGDFGTVRAGRMVTPYFQALVLTDPFAQAPWFSPQAFITYRGLQGTGLAGNTSLNNLIGYISPTFSGVTANVVYGLGEVAGNAGANQMQGTVTYRGGRLDAVLALQRARFNNAAGDFTLGLVGQNAAMLGVSYDFGPAKLFGQYQQMKNVATTGNFDNRVYQGGFSVPISLGYLLGSYGKSSVHGRNVNRDVWAIGYDYYLSKRTDVYVNYINDASNVASTGRSAGVGIRTRF